MSDTVRLMHYDPRWKQEFQQTRSSLFQSCQGWVTAVEHIGSTAIEGLIARPTIDIMAGINTEADPDADAFLMAAELIEGLNFRRDNAPLWTLPQQSHRSELDGKAIQLVKPRHGTPTHQVLLLHQQSPSWIQAIGIREQLRKDRELAFRFEETKVARWRSGEGNPERYQHDKSIFFTHLADQLGSDLK